MNRFDPPPDLGNANVGTIDKLLMRAYPLRTPFFCAIGPASGCRARTSRHLPGNGQRAAELRAGRSKRLPCSHEQTFAGQRTASSGAESWKKQAAAVLARADICRAMKGGNTMREYLENVRNTVPLVHNITNYVTVNDVANVLLACGGSPIMSDEAEDVEDITSVCADLTSTSVRSTRQASRECSARGREPTNWGIPYCSTRWEPVQALCGPTQRWI